MKFLGDDHFNRPLFQNLVQAFANTKRGRRDLGLRPNIPKDRSIVGLHRNRVTYLTNQKYPGWIGARRQLVEEMRAGKPPQLTTVFNTYSKYSHRLQALQEGATNDYVDSLVGAYLRWRRNGLPLIHGLGPRVAYADETTFLSDPNPETTSVDGWAASINANLSWYHHMAQAGSNFHDSSSYTYMGIFKSYYYSPRFHYVCRGISLFDTSVIGTGGEVTAGTWEAYGSYKTDTGGWGGGCNIYSSNPASNTGLTGADYSTCGSTPWATTRPYAALNIGTWTVWTLNATGRAAVAVDGITKTSQRESTYDAGTATPTWSANKNWQYRVYSADMGGEGYDLKLVLTYTPGGGGGGSLAHINMALLGVG